ncbi:hypothetical protein AVEN_99668-1 [Araneus ventricosus]|uniref:Uncharacterized protein n=1 Tax=Araneus ventricosus TaxID=182803 RepID=A0A4Y2DLZ8_ARAVE|nr:hypothetical protein AVEN_99668-1 [Araneus ventricosus]
MGESERARKAETLRPDSHSHHQVTWPLPLGSGQVWDNSDDPCTCNYRGRVGSLMFEGGQTQRDAVIITICPTLSSGWFEIMRGQFQ